MIHIFNKDISNIQLPEAFTFPFHYTPHPLCVCAAKEVQAYLQTRADWHEELEKGIKVAADAEEYKLASRLRDELKGRKDGGNNG